MVGQFSTLLISIDAPLRMLLEDPNASQFIPRKLLKKNKYGAYINGIKLIIVLAGSIILAQILVPGAATVLRQLTKLNSITMPLRYLWVFLAYIFLRKNRGDVERDFYFTHNQGVALFFGFWCFIVTLACCILGMISDDPMQMALNVITPLVLVALGVILPMIRAKEDKKLS